MVVNTSFHLINGRLFLLLGSIRIHGNAADKSLIVYETFAKNDYAAGRDFILANILGVVSAPHLDNDHDLAKLSVDRYVS